MPDIETVKKVIGAKKKVEETDWTSIGKNIAIAIGGYAATKVGKVAPSPIGTVAQGVGYGAIAYGLYKTFGSFGAKRKMDKAPIPETVMPTEAPAKRMATETIPLFYQAGYISELTRDRFVKTRDTEKRNRLQLSMKTMPDDAYKALMQFVDDITGGILQKKQFKVIPDYTAEYPDPRTLTEKVQKKNQIVSNIISKAGSIGMISREDFDTVSRIELEARPIIKAYYDHENAGEPIPDIYKKERWPITLETLKKAQKLVFKKKIGDKNITIALP